MEREVVPLPPEKAGESDATDDGEVHFITMDPQEFIEIFKKAADEIRRERGRERLVLSNLR